MIAFYDVHHVWAVDIVILQFAAFRPKTRLVMRFSRKIKIGLERIVEENPIRIPFLYTDVKRNATIQRILVELERIGIRIPVGKAPSAEVKVGRLITQPIKRLVDHGYFGTV